MAAALPGLESAEPKKEDMHEVILKVIIFFVLVQYKTKLADTPLEASSGT